MKETYTLPEHTLVAAGPVIIENGKVLLNREIKQNDAESPFFMFPGGRFNILEETPEEACAREAKEEMGIAIEILRPLKTVIVKHPDVVDGYAILIHFLARRTSDISPPTARTAEWGWFDINDLPKNATDNVKEVIDAYRNEIDV